MSPTRLFTTASAVVLFAGFAPQLAAAQATATAQTEAAAQAATGKATTDAPAQTQVQGAAQAVADGVAATPAAQPSTVAQALKPVAPAGDLVDTLKASGQFTTFIKAVDSTNLTSVLKTYKNLTVFAPTDAAFQAMGSAELQALMSNKTALQKLLTHHIINAPVDSSKIAGAKGPVPSVAADNILLDGSQEGVLKADGATIVQADVRASNGILHVVDKVLVSGQGDTAPATADAGATGEAATGQAAASSATAPEGTDAPR